MNNADVIEELCRISVKCFWLIPAILGGIGTLLTLMGSSLPKLFVQLPEFRNRKTVKYIICDKILYKRRERSFINAYFLCFCKIYYFLLYPLFFFGFLSIYLKFISKNQYFIQLVPCIVMGLSYFGAKILKNRSLKGNIYWETLIFIFTMVLLMLNTILYFESNAIIAVSLALGFIIMDICAASLISGIFVESCYKSKTVKILTFFRHFFFYLTYGYIYPKQNGADNMQNLYYGFILWIIFCTLELVVNQRALKEKVCVNIYTTGGKRITTSRIVQYGGAKVKYKTVEGVTEIIDEEDIQYISYIPPQRISTDLMEAIRGESSVDCVFKNIELQETEHYKITTYKYKCESWILMNLKAQEGRCNIIINANRIKKIVYRNKIPHTSDGEVKNGEEFDMAEKQIMGR